MSYRSSVPPDFCTNCPLEPRLYQAFIFVIPLFFTLVLLFLFYLRHRRAHWTSLQMRVSREAEQEISRPSDSGLKKEVREMLPVVIFRESFSVRESQCSVCLGDYKSDDQLKRIPACGHTFHVDCIDHWLSTNITCPLCRSSLVPTPRASLDPTNLERQFDLEAQTGSPEVATGHEQLQSGLTGTVVEIDAYEIGMRTRSCTIGDVSASGVKNVGCKHGDEDQNAV